MAEWMTGVMMIDQLAIEIFMGAISALNNTPGTGGVTVVSMPVETAAAIQTERTSSVETGLIIYTVRQIFGDGDLYPI